MAWTTPATAVAGSTALTAAFWNEQVRDNTAYLKAEADAVGLVHIATLSGTNVSEFLFSDVFTTADDHYVAVFSIETLSSAVINFRFRDSGGDYITGYYVNTIGSNFNADTAAFGGRKSNAAEGIIGLSTTTGGPRTGVMNIHNPADSSLNTTFHGTLGLQSAAEGYVFGGRSENDDHTGIRFYASTGNISGEVKLYRYAGS